MYFLIGLTSNLDIPIKVFIILESQDIQDFSVSFCRLFHRIDRITLNIFRHSLFLQKYYQSNPKVSTSAYTEVGKLGFLKNRVSKIGFTVIPSNPN